MDLAACIREEKTRDAVERCLQRISEAPYRLGNYLDDLYLEARRNATRGVDVPLGRQYDRISDREIRMVYRRRYPPCANQPSQKLRGLKLLGGPNPTEVRRPRPRHRHDIPARTRTRHPNDGLDHRCLSSYLTIQSIDRLPVRPSTT